MVDIVVKNGRLVTPEGTVSAGLAIDGGRIVGVMSEANLPRAGRVVDAKGNYVLPGVIDAHFHAAWPDWDLEEAVRKDSVAAAFGGVTTVVNRLTEPPSSLVAALPHRRRSFERSCHVDFALQVPIYTEEQIAEIPELFRMGVSGFKFYIPYRGAEVVPPMVGIDDGIVYMGFAEIAKVGHPARAQVHCENIEPFFRLKHRLVEAGREDLAAWAEARPNFLEAEAVIRCTYFSAATNCPLQVVHMSARESVELVRRARADGVDVVVEVQPQYLTLTKDGAYGVLGKVNPPLRSREDHEALWKALRDGVIDMVSSDHAPCAKKHKMKMWDAVVGFAGVETYVPVMVTEGVLKGRISIERLAEVCSTNVAKAYGLYPRKGALLPGADADITILDLKREVRVSAERLHHISDFTPYEGMTLRGWALLTMVRGRSVVEGEQLVGEAGYGRYLSCGAAA